MAKDTFGYILGDFLKNASGRPDCECHVLLTVGELPTVKMPKSKL
jgi:hypothetical protein